jgi:hypothetical protein
MSEVKHTPGPWKVCVGNSGSIFGDLNNRAHDGDNPYIGTVAGIGVDQDIPECTANAKLIAAAPELLTAAKEALHFIRTHNHYVAACMIDKLQAVIDKATTQSISL